MASRKTELRVGITIVLGLLILAASLYWLQGVQLTSNSRVVRVLFDDVGTLSIGDKVTVSGVYKGKVDGMDLTDKGVVVTLFIARDVTLRSDASFIIKNMGVMGERFVSVDPGDSSATLNYEATHLGEYDTGLPEVMGLMGDMIVELRKLVISFKQTVGSDTSLNRFNNMLINLERVSASMAGYMERNEDRLDSTAQNFLAASDRLNRMLARNSASVDSTVERINRTSASLEHLTYRLDTLSAAAREFADALNNPDGSLQQMLNDPRLYNDLRRTADNLDDLVADIRENPDRYISLRFSLF